jgi:3-oxoacyl-[acyl-carrier protein] reductase
MEEQIPIGRVGVPEDIGYMVTFLCSDDVSYCTGPTYFVDDDWLLVNPCMN